jgi:hypothetical protein
MASPVPAQERLRGWLCGNLLFGRRPYADSRVQLTEGRRCKQRAWRRLVVPGSHSAGEGAAVLGMVAQRRGWDGCTAAGMAAQGRRRGGRRAPLV